MQFIIYLLLKTVMLLFIVYYYLSEKERFVFQTVSIQLVSYQAET